MRVTGGRLRGRRLAPPKGAAIRPTADRVREAVFNLLGHDLTEARVLDLFAGTGCLGIEALSRGAGRAVFVDRSLEAVRLIHNNLARCGLEHVGVVLRRDLRRGLPSHLPQAAFDLVFIDPPYGGNLVAPVLAALLNQRTLALGARVVVETSRREPAAPIPGALAETVRRRYGDTNICIYDYLEAI